MRVPIAVLPSQPIQIIPPDRRVNAFVFNSGAVNVQISENPTALQILQAGAFTDGIPLAAGSNIALLRWKCGLYAATTAAAAQLTIIIDEESQVEKILSGILAGINGMLRHFGL